MRLYCTGNYPHPIKENILDATSQFAASVALIALEYVVGSLEFIKNNPGEYLSYDRVSLLNFRGNIALVGSLIMAGMAGVALLLLPCSAGSGSLEVLAGAVEAVDHNAALVCMGNPSGGGVTSANVTLCSSMRRSATVCMPDSLKTMSVGQR